MRCIRMLNKKQLNQLYQYCYSLTNNPDDSYDLLQMSIEKYLKLKQNKTKYGTSYMRTIIRNQFIDNYRRKNKIIFESIDSKNYYSTLAIDTSSLDDLMIAQENLLTIWKLLDNSEREITYLWAMQGYTAKQISQELSIPRGTILSKIHRIREKIVYKFHKSKKVGRN